MRAVVQPSTVTEGEDVRLSCTLDCPSSPPSVVWFRDDQPVTNLEFRDAQPVTNLEFRDAQPVTNLEFQASIKDASSYYCAVRGQDTIRSAPVTLNVQCKYLIFRPLNSPYKR